MQESRLIDLLKAVGGAALSVALPVKTADAIVGVVNAVLPPGTAPLDSKSVTGQAIMDQISQLAPEVQKAVTERTFDLEQQAQEAEEELTQSLADVDSKGRSFRPTIAVGMAVLLAIDIIGYNTLLFLSCIGWANVRLPTWDELTIPILVPALIVVTYFGFAKRERAELLSLVLNHTPAGRLAGGTAAKVLDLVSNAKK